MTDTERRALEAAARSAETWDSERHGWCEFNWFHKGCDTFDDVNEFVKEPYDGPTEHG